MGDHRELSGGVVEQRPIPLPLPTPAPSPALIGSERWAKAEKATDGIIHKVQPTHASEERRRKVIDYVQRLIKGSLGCEVFPYGSVPLKTYLPDGDIDLTAFGGINIEDALANGMVSLLEGEEQNGNAEFVVKDVKLIRAEVKIVKCIVQNIVVDISVNQIGGVCTLCFLEQVDRLIGKDHLFKRSIILIKSWCYYESRILGAHHGLISTYGLETLVLYIFHLFHSTLDGPLSVLYKFLDYFSKFDWDNYCISLTGPVPISSLPEIVAERPENDGGDLLLSTEFLRYSVDMFSVPSRGVDTGSRAFLQKHLNIVDPLKENNNLGRSVSKGNFYRIRSAFAYGARKLGRILMQPEDVIADELHIFFSNTLERHGYGERPDVQDSGLLFNTIPFSPTRHESRVYSNASSDEGFDGNKVPRMGTKVFMVSGEQERSKEEYHSKMSSQTNECLVGPVRGLNSEDLTRSKFQGTMFSNDIAKNSDSSAEESVSGRVDIPYYAPHLFFTKSKISKRSDGKDCVQNDNQMVDRDESLAGGSDVSVAPNAIPIAEDNSSTALGVSSAGDPESTNALSDLSGDYESHFSCLQYGRWCFEHGLGVPVFSVPPRQPHFPMNIPWDVIQHPPAHLKRNRYPRGSANGVIPSSAIFAMNPPPMPGAAFGLEDMPKPRGTGLYFPNMIRPPLGYRPSVPKGRNQPPLRSPRTNGRYAIFTESNNHDRSSHELTQSEVPFDQSGMKLDPSAVQRLFPSPRMGRSIVNGLVVQTEGFVGYGSVGQVPPAAPFLERGRQQRLSLSSPNSPISASVSPTMGMQRVGPVFSRDHDRVSMKSLYRLKNEDDFPPLPV